MTYGFLAAAVLFLSSGNLVWADGWYYVVAAGLAQLATAWTLAFADPDVLRERSAALTGEAAKAWDRWPAPLATFAPLTVPLVAGLADRLR